jgi:primary-amine oxidase
MVVSIGKLRTTGKAIPLCLLLCFPGIAAATDQPPTHPLDPLNKTELAATVQILRRAGKAHAQSRFTMVALQEPPKEEVLAFKAGKRFRREAFAVVYERAGNKTFETVVDLHGNKVVSWKHIPGVQPSDMVEDFQLADQIVRADPRWQEAVRKRGINNFDEVAIDPWPAGEHGVPSELGMRVLSAVSFYRGQARNYYARPIEGVVAYVNLNTKKVFKVVDTGVVPVAGASADLDPDSVGKLRKAPRPLLPSQPQGASFEVRGHEVRWQNWHFRFALHPREGLVLHTVGYEDQGKLRSILYRGSLSELFVPYGDPGPGWSFRHVFDMGETGLGWLANSLEPKTDCPENAVFFDAAFANETGEVHTTPRAVALYERDGGLLWKHYDYTTNESRRARQLVLTFISTAGNYEYGLNWIFHQDGCLEAEVMLTGIMASKGVARTREEHGKQSHGHLVAANVEAVHHQHFFNFRLDLDIEAADGNQVVELNTEAVPPSIAPDQRNALVMKETLLHTEQEARRTLHLATGRKWKVINPCEKNSLGQSVGYTLVPGENAVPFIAPNTPLGQRAGFMFSHVWVTPYDPAQMNAAGPYVYHDKGSDGLPRWTAANRSVDNVDVVLWYTLGVTHIPRPEEWPVMPVHRAGFKLVPSGFFVRNPALDVPRPRKAVARNASGGS